MAEESGASDAPTLEDVEALAGELISTFKVLRANVRATPSTQTEAVKHVLGRLYTHVAGELQLNTPAAPPAGEEGSADAVAPAEPEPVPAAKVDAALRFFVRTTVQQLQALNESEGETLGTTRNLGASLESFVGVFEAVVRPDTGALVSSARRALDAESRARSAARKAAQARKDVAQAEAARQSNVKTLEAAAAQATQASREKLSAAEQRVADLQRELAAMRAERDALQRSNQQLQSERAAAVERAETLEVFESSVNQMRQMLETEVEARRRAEEQLAEQAAAAAAAKPAKSSLWGRGK